MVDKVHELVTSGSWRGRMNQVVKTLFEQGLTQPASIGEFPNRVAFADMMKAGPDKKGRRAPWFNFMAFAADTLLSKTPKLGRKPRASAASLGGGLAAGDQGVANACTEDAVPSPLAPPATEVKAVSDTNGTAQTVGAAATVGGSGTPRAVSAIKGTPTNRRKGTRAVANVSSDDSEAGHGNDNESKDKRARKRRNAAAKGDALRTASTSAPAVSELLATMVASVSAQRTAELAKIDAALDEARAAQARNDANAAAMLQLLGAMVANQAESLKLERERSARGFQPHPDQLQGQFGPGLSHPAQFQGQFRQDLRQFSPVRQTPSSNSSAMTLYDSGPYG